MSATEILVTIAGSASVTFNDYGSGTPAYILRNTSKLLSTLSTRQTKNAKQGAHGVFDSLSFYDERVLPFEGEICGDSQADRKTKEEALKRCLSLPALPSYAGDDGYMLVTFTDEDGSLKQCYAKTVQPPTFDIMDDADPARRAFSFVMMAKDPTLYGQTLNQQASDETVAGTNLSIVQNVAPMIPFSLYLNTVPSITCVNNGTIDTPPILIIDGPSLNPKVLNETSGVFMLLDGLTLLSGERVEIDVANQAITKYDASDVASNASGYLSADSTWLLLKAGSNALALTDDTPDAISAVLTAKWRDAYI